MRASLATSLTLGSALVAASPLVVPRADAVTLTTEAYNNLIYYAQYSASAYCNSQDAVGGLVTCEGGCPAVMANGVTVLGVFPNTTAFDLEGYVALDTVRREIVVAFRGSVGVRNWIADFDFALAPFAACDHCRVHDGFQRAWREVQPHALGLVQAARAQHPGYALVVAGHSLGAAVATLAAVALRRAGLPCDVYTVGSPRVGNAAFAAFATAQPGGAAHRRATHFEDPVPRLPPLVLGYAHTSPEFWLAAGPAAAVAYPIGRVASCAGYANTSCNAGTAGFDLEAHGYYFQYLACDPAAAGGATAVAADRRSLAGRQAAAGAGGVTDEELAVKLTYYTMQDIAYARQLADEGV